MKDFEKKTLDFLDDDSDICIDSNNKYIKYLAESKFNDKRNDLKLILHFISKVSNNYHRSRAFFKKIEAIISFFSEKIKQNFPNDIIFDIFKGNKRILLFLFEKEIITINSYIANIITSIKFFKKGYPNYFIKEIKSFITDELYEQIEKENQSQENNSLSFDEKRKIGENDSYICSLIRNDSVVDFISYINSTNLPLGYKIEKSFFETNSFLFDKQPSLIEYAAFFGSIQIFKYLHFNKIKVDESLGFYAIHGNNPEIIHIIEENFSGQMKTSFAMNLFKESIKCHHNDVAEYIHNNIFENSMVYNSDIISKFLKYYNFQYINVDQINGSILDFLCRYDYIDFVESLLAKGDIDINMIEISIFLYFLQNLIFLNFLTELQILLFLIQFQII